MPPATLNAFKDHGRVSLTLEQGIHGAKESLKKLGSLGIDLEDITEKLQVDGALSFTESYNKLLKSLEDKTNELQTGMIIKQEMKLGTIQARVDERLKKWTKINFARRLYEKDSTLWSKKPLAEISNRLGWFDLPESMHDRLDELIAFAEEIKKEGFKHVVLLGMGGSSLAAELYSKTFGNKRGYPDLIVLDSTHPEGVKGIEDKTDFHKTLFIVASKSGTTLEPNILFQHFWQKTEGLKEKRQSHFIAITDPDSPLSRLAQKKGFRKVFHAHPDLGGRYSALSAFGLLPAALIGVDVHRLLDRAWVAKEACAFCVEETEMLGLRLGAALGELALTGRDKITLHATPSLHGFPGWLEQLIAESTGKDGRGIVPVAGEPRLNPKLYGEDRVFVLFSLKEEENQGLEEFFKNLEKRGHPVIKMRLMDKLDISQEVFKWEVAITALSTIIGVHPFTQPDVELSKELARRAMKQRAAKTGVDGAINASNGEKLRRALKKWTSLSREGDYISIQAFINQSTVAGSSIQRLKKLLAENMKIPVTMGFGPRFLHSTGQLHKGGPNTGLFLQLIDNPIETLKVPEADYTFRDVIQAQSLGDYRALKEKGRRIIRIKLGSDAKDGFEKVINGFGGLSEQWSLG